MSDPRRASEEDTAPAAPYEPARRPGMLARGQALGRFVVLGEVGEGGMATVYSAYDPQLDRRVALKVLRPFVGGASAEARLRLVREAQALAKVVHPNVVVVFDVGVHGDTVFLAQELLDGGTLEEWLQLETRGAGEVLRLFVLAGRGLAAAHAVGLVHRDFKPSNVLLGKDGRVRVTDFGLARLVLGPEEPPALHGSAPPSPLESPLTVQGTVVGTPMFMAPEQRRGAVADPRADQFSFCVSLFLALYREHPFGEGNGVERAHNASSGKITTPSHPERAPSFVHRALLRGLRPRPEDRFPSMEELLVALTHDPARARRRGLLVTGIALLLGGAAVAGYALGPRRDETCRVDRSELAGAWDDGTRSAVRAALLTTGVPWAGGAADRVERTLDRWAESWIDARRDACEATRVRRVQSEDMLDRRMACLTVRRQELGALAQVLSRADAKVAERAAQAAQALPPLTSCDASALVGAPALPPAKAARVTEVRGELARAFALHTAGRFAESSALAAQLLGEARRLEVAPLVAEVAYRLGNSQALNGQHAEAEAMLLEALVAAEGARHDEVAARAATELSFVVGYLQGDPRDGRRWGQLARAAVTRLGRDEPGILARVATNLGSVAYAEGKYAEAQAHFAHALETRLRSLPPGHSDLASTYNNLAAAYEAQSRFAEAAVHAAHAISLYQSAHGPDHPDTAKGLTNLGRIYLFLDRFEDAEELQRRALAIAVAGHGERHPIVASIRHNLVEIHLTRGQYDQALELARRVLAERLEQLGPEHSDVARIRFYVGQALLGLERPADAGPELAAALAVFESTYGKEHAFVAYPLLDLALVALAQGEPARAVPLAERALALRRGGESPTVLAQTQSVLARALDGATRAGRARALGLAHAAAQGFAIFPPSDAPSRREQAALARWLEGK